MQIGAPQEQCIRREADAKSRSQSQQQQQQHTPRTRTMQDDDNDNDSMRRRTEALLHSSKQPMPSQVHKLTNKQSKCDSRGCHDRGEFELEPPVLAEQTSRTLGLSLREVQCSTHRPTSLYYSVSKSTALTRATNCAPAFYEAILIFAATERERDERRDDSSERGRVSRSIHRSRTHILTHRRSFAPTQLTRHTHNTREQRSA